LNCIRISLHYQTHSQQKKMGNLKNIGGGGQDACRGIVGKMIDAKKS
jgi:hypothetical protein